MLLIALVYVAYPFISTVPTFFSELRTANWSWALLGLTVSALTYVGAAARGNRRLVVVQMYGTGDLYGHAIRLLDWGFAQP